MLMGLERAQEPAIEEPLGAGAGFDHPNPMRPPPPSPLFRACGAEELARPLVSPTQYAGNGLDASLVKAVSRRELPGFVWLVINKVAAKHLPYPFLPKKFWDWLLPRSTGRGSPAWSGEEGRGRRPKASRRWRQSLRFGKAHCRPMR